MQIICNRTIIVQNTSPVVLERVIYRTLRYVKKTIVFTLLQSAAKFRAQIVHINLCSFQHKNVTGKLHCAGVITSPYFLDPFFLRWSLYHIIVL